MRAGCKVAIIDFELCPKVSLQEQINQSYRASEAILKHAAGIGGRSVNKPLYSPRTKNSLLTLFQNRKFRRSFIRCPSAHPHSPPVDQRTKFTHRSHPRHLFDFGRVRFDRGLFNQCRQSRQHSSSNPGGSAGAVTRIF